MDIYYLCTVSLTTNISPASSLPVAYMRFIPNLDPNAANVLLDVAGPGLGAESDPSRTLFSGQYIHKSFLDQLTFPR